MDISAFHELQHGRRPPCWSRFGKSRDHAWRPPPILGGYSCKTFVVISLVVLDIPSFFWWVGGWEWPLNKICQDTFRQYPCDTYLHAMAKCGENRSLESWRNVMVSTTKTGCQGRVRAPDFVLTELIAPNNLCFPTSWRHLPFRFVVRIVCVRVFFYTCIKQMNNSGV